MDSLAPIALPLDVMRGQDLNQPARRGKALQDLEALFVGLLVKEMRKTVPESGLYEKSPAQTMFQEMLDEVYAQKLAESGQLGIAKLIEGQIDVQSKQADVREKLVESLGQRRFVDLIPAEIAPPFFELPQKAQNKALMTVKSRAGSADTSSDGPE